MAESRLGIAQVEVRATLDKLDEDLKGAKSKVENALSASMQKLGKQMSKLGSDLTKKVSLPLAALGGVAAKTAGDFEAAMNILEIAARKSGTAVDDLSKAAVQVGSDVELVGIDAMQAAEAMTTFYKAGLETNDIFADLQGYLAGTVPLTGALRSAIDLAAASDLDLAAASEVVAVAMATFGLSAQDAARIADSFVGAADASVAEVGDLADALINVGPTAAQFGYTLEDVNTALALLSTRGITGAEAGTSLKSMMVNLLRPTEAVTEALQELNISLYDEHGALKPLPQIINELAVAMAGQTDEQRNQYIQTLAGTYGMRAMATLLGEGKTGWDAMTVAIADSASAQEVAEARTRGFNAAMEQLKGALQTFMIVAGTPLINDVLTPMANKLRMVTERAIEMDPKILRLGLVFAGLLGALGPVLWIGGKLVTGWGLLWGAGVKLAGILGPVLLPVLGQVGTTIGAIATGPVGLLIAMVALLAAGWQFNWFGMRDVLTEFWNSTGAPILELLRSWLSERLTAAIRRLEEFWLTVLLPALRQIWTYIQEELIPLLETLRDWLWARLTAALDRLRTFWLTVLLPALQTIWDYIQNTVLPLFETLRAWLSETLTAATQKLADYWNNTLKPALQAVWEFIDLYVIPILADLVDIYFLALDIAVTAMAGLWQNVLKPALSAVWDYIKNNVMPMFTDLTRDGLDKAREASDKLSAFWSGTLKPALQVVSDLVRDVVGPAFSWFREKVIDRLTGALHSLRDALQWVKDRLNELKAALANLQLPSWLTPGSPTPLEMGLRGIGAAMEKLVRARLPQLQAGLDLSLAPGMAAAMRGGDTITNARTYQLQVMQQRIDDPRSLADMVRLMEAYGGV